ncbi:formylglycine-generating enzyme family protein [Streptomyces sp. NPDC054933]
MELAEVAASPHFKEYAALAEPCRVPPVAAGSLHHPDPAGLARLVEDAGVPLADRLAAGTVLAVLGDPRITPAPATSFVPGGTVQLGLDPAAVARTTAAWAHVGVVESWIEKETPAHSVRLDDFWIGSYPVTNAEYRDFLHDTGHERRPCTWYLGAYPWERSNHPVAGVSPQDADAYAAWLSRRTGHPWRLPTEAEWEYAAKGPDGREFPWGDDFDPARANTRETGVHTTTPVGAFPAGRSPFGAYDMAGNVEEYVADHYTPYPGGPFVDDHLVQSIGDYRVARGGSFCRFGDLARTRRRHGAFPGPLYPVGFRLATSERPA